MNKAGPSLIRTCGTGLAKRQLGQAGGDAGITIPSRRVQPVEDPDLKHCGALRNVSSWWELGKTLHMTSSSQPPAIHFLHHILPGMLAYAAAGLCWVTER